MARRTARTRYRGPILLTVASTLAATIAAPFIAWQIDVGPWWQRLLFVAIVIPTIWWYTLARSFYRMDLTDTHLRLGSLLVRHQIPLADLAEIGAPDYGNSSSVRVVRRDGRSWSVLTGEGLVDFTDEVHHVAPHVQVRLSGWERRIDRSNKFFAARRANRRWPGHSRGHQR